ncbi:MAG: polyamine aminopropyltransferase [Thermoplasmata archaeon]
MRLIENWFSERYSDNLQLSFRVKDQLLSVRTDFQRIDVFDTYDYGKLLTIDGTVQMSEYDEFVYHEMITMVPYYYVDHKPRNALVIGGGDGGTATRLSQIGIQEITNVEIDTQVVEVSKQFFPHLTSVFDKKGVNLLIQDGIKYLEETKQKFDLIIIDSTDPEGPAEGLFSRSFYQNAKKALNPGGVFVTQSGSPYYQPKAIKMAYSGLSGIFSHVKPYTAFIPTYPSGFWSFTLATDSARPLESNICKPGKYFNSEVLNGSFYLPQFVKELIGV